MMKKANLQADQQSLIDMYPRPVGRILWSVTEQAANNCKAGREIGNTDW